MRGFVFIIFVLTLHLLAMQYSTAAQQIAVDKSHLRVAVTDAQKKVIAGADCSLLKEKLVVAHRLTDESGAAVFDGVTMGAYDLRIEKAGFQTLVKGQIKLDVGELEIAVTLNVADVAAQVTVNNVSDEVGGVDSGSSPPTGKLNGRALERLPLATRRVDEAIPLVPGVIRSTTGEISIKGATEQQSAFRVNGVNVTDPASGNFRLNLPVDAVESVQVFQHPYSAEFGQFTGGITDIETKHGGDKWHFELNDFLPDFRFVNGKVHGIQDDSPHLNFNGPLIKNRLSISQSLGYSISKVPVRGLVFPNNETISESQSYFTQADLTVSPTHSVVATAGYFPERQSFVGLDYFRQRPVTPNYKQKDYIVTVHDNYTFKNGGLLRSSASYKRFFANVWGQGSGEQTITPVGEFGNYFAMQDRRSSRLELFATYDLPAQQWFSSTHNLKGGFNYSEVKNWMNYAARPVNIRRFDGTLAERTTFENSRLIRVKNRTYTGFLQDRWTLRPNLSIDAGLRMEDQRIAQERNVSPRAGFAWSPFKGDTMIFRGGIGFFYDKVPLNIRAFSRYPARTVTRYLADGQTIIDQHSFENILVDNPDLFPLDFRKARSRIGFVPQNLTWNLQLDKAINSSINLRAVYTHSRTDRIYTVGPETDYLGRTAIVLSPKGRASYDALELTARFTLPKDQPFYVSYVRSKARGDLNDFNSYYGDFGSAIIRQNQYSNLPTDVPNRVLAWGSISLPKKFTLSPIFEWRSGFPYSILNNEQNYVGLRNANGHRFPHFLSLDMEISKDFQVTPKYGIRLSLKVFNLTNHFNPRNVRNNLNDPDFGKFINNYRRYFTGGFDIIF